MPCLSRCFLVYLPGRETIADRLLPEKGKLVVRRGRKATEPSGSAGLPKEGGLSGHRSLRRNGRPYGFANVRSHFLHLAHTDRRGGRGNPTASCADRCASRRPSGASPAG